MEYKLKLQLSISMNLPVAWLKIGVGVPPTNICSNSGRNVESNELDNYKLY
jgi:hypothetical protein